MRYLPPALIALATAALLAFALLAARSSAAPYERSCDGKPATFHVKRAKALIRHAYRDERWQSGPEGPIWQEHKHCVRDAGLRKKIASYRERKAEAFSDYRALRRVAPFPGPGDTWWAIPYYIVSCESYGGRWDVVSYDGGYGPYQFTGWGGRFAWPVRTAEDKLTHHRLARFLWTTYGSSQWVCA
jgi:hypothetical protein